MAIEEAETATFGGKGFGDGSSDALGCPKDGDGLILKMKIHGGAGRNPGLKR